MKIVKFLEHYNTVVRNLLKAENDYKDAMWLLDHAKGDEDNALSNAEICELRLSVIKEEKSRLNSIVEKAKDEEERKGRNLFGFKIEYYFQFKDISVPKKVADILY